MDQFDDEEMQSEMLADDEDVAEELLDDDELGDEGDEDEDGIMGKSDVPKMRSRWPLTPNYFSNGAFPTRRVTCR